MEQRQKMLQLQEMVQAMVQDMELEAIIEVIAVSAEENANATTDSQRRAQLRWYARQFRKLQQGPPDGLPGEHAPRKPPRAALEDAFRQLVLRANKMAEMTIIGPADLEWVDKLSRELGMVATRMGL